jgi:ribosomal protein S18 acetylase RimI-like enzyme
MALENPFWAALTTTHAAHAQDVGALKRFAPDVAPFCAVGHADADIRSARGAQPGEVLNFLGVIPALPDGWSVLQRGAVLQMVYAGASAVGDAADAGARVLGAADLPAMLELTGLVYPEYFRPRSAILGKYIGLHHDGQLVAMAGQRMASTGYREISAVCTHPAHTGRGHARHLIAQLAQAILAEGRTPFLHVSASNERAWGLYQDLGFAASCELRLVKVGTT